MCSNDKWNKQPTQAQLEVQWEALRAFHIYKQQLFTAGKETPPKRCTGHY